MVADMEVDMVADMEVDKVADMEVDKVARLTSTLTPTWAWTLTLTLTFTSTWKSNLVRELVTGVGLLDPNFFDPKLTRIHQHFHFPELGQQRNGKNMAKWLKCWRDQTKEKQN